MNRLIEWLEEHDAEILLMDGFDDALIGTINRVNEPVLAVYDWHLMVDVLVNNDNMEYEEAVEYIDFNVIGAWVGPQTPVVLHRPEWINITSTAPEQISHVGAPEIDGQLSVFDADPNWTGVAPI